MIKSLGNISGKLVKIQANSIGKILTSSGCQNLINKHDFIYLAIEDTPTEIGILTPQNDLVYFDKYSMCPI